MRADMAAALGNDDAHDGCFAAGAGHTGATKYVQLVCIASRAIVG